MTIGVEQLESWIGTDAHDSSGDKLGKIDDVYFAGDDDRLRDMAPGDIEGWQQREERRKEAEKAYAEAEKLEAEVVLRAEEEDKAAARAGDAESSAESARREREDVEARAKEARAAADRAS